MKKNTKHSVYGGKVYTIVVYDVSVERVTKVCHYLRTRLNWVQNSVFEGDLTGAELAEVELRLKDLIDEKEDSVTFYMIRSEKALSKKHLGIEKADLNRII